MKNVSIKVASGKDLKKTKVFLGNVNNQTISQKADEREAGINTGTGQTEEKEVGQEAKE